MDKSIEYIHNNKLAIPNKKYFGKDGTVYIGLPNKRLKVVESTNIINTNNSVNNSNNDTNINFEEIEIDFGTFPSKGKKFIISNILISTISKIIVSPSGSVATGRVGDDWEWDSINFTAKANTGTFTLTAKPLGYIKGKRKIFYTWQ